MDKLVIKEALVKYSRYCAMREVCSSDIRKKLLNDKKLGLSKAQTNKIIDILIDEGFINEERFAAAFVNDHYKFNKWGRIKIKYMLNSKGIKEQYIDNALKSIPSEEYLDILRSLMKEKWSKLEKEEDYYTKKMKCANFLAGRGFESDLIFNEIEKL
ncbi:regulatory protein RecX [Marinigracilibium pacificum]|uniref:Regulatory protein RecX n=1 Tax=Marinigracilibium pacificum TaxID=2729599 RepID=A0A848IX00_9BACT|nr:regulatory protein RecX [Marinigracilibium pacificum]NMM46784.1 RecX family transcriptional regulator [Marinigracilibium pacificum]